MTALLKYDAARAALAQCVRVDEVLAIRDEAERLKLYARQANDTDLLSDAVEIHSRAERQLGVLIVAAKAAGQIARGRPKSENGSGAEPFRVTLAEANIDKKLSMRAQKVASISERAFEAMVARTRERIAAGAAIVIDREQSTANKKERRAVRERVLGGIQCALPQQKFGVILADPEWRFEPWSRDTGMDRAADNHYPTSCTEVIAARDVPLIAADDAVLFLCATAPMLPHALLVMAAWGFDYKSNYVLVKDRPITGYWNRNRHEHLLIGTRGNIPCPAPGTQWESLIDAPVNKHSAKPEALLEMIEAYFPTLPRIELNRRGPTRKGWAAWGNESSSPSPLSERGGLRG